jgi:hypothetical protein
MADRKYRVVTDTWGANPQFMRGTTIVIRDKNDKQYLVLPDGREIEFAADIPHAMGNGTVVALGDDNMTDEERHAQELQAAQASIAYNPLSSGQVSSMLPSGDAARTIVGVTEVTPPEGNDPGVSPAEGMNEGTAPPEAPAEPGDGTPPPDDKAPPSGPLGATKPPTTPKK